ncbi:MAG TPA: cyclic nucleotide-binding domain-containing protein [Chloroflexota bacterium]|nr:cyclic nucleotide-binding domain-containing protein [Chloroflexota bacterium]
MSMEGARSATTRAGSSPPGHDRLWAAVKQRSTVTTPGDIWRPLAERLDFARYVPTPSPDVETSVQSTASGETYYVLRSRTARYIRLQEEDFALWWRMDGRQSIREIALAHFLEHGDFGADRLARLVRELRAGGFLGPTPPDCFDSIDRRVKAAKFLATRKRRLSKVIVLELFRIGGADQIVSAIYRYGGWLLYTRPALALWALMIVGGLAVWWYQFLLAGHPLFQTRGSYTLGFLTLCALDLIGINIHALAQAVTVKRHGRRINGAGLLLYYLLPVVYFETSDVWMAQRRQRIAVSWSGPCAMLISASLLAILALRLDGTEAGSLMFKGATIWFANAFFNLLPILDLDGYFILVDWLEMPALRTNSMAFIRHALWSKLRARQPLTREERVLAGFGLLSVLLVILIPLVILQARDLRYADTLMDLWNQPALQSRAMAIGIGLVFLGPAAFTIVGRIAKSLAAVARLLVRRWRRRRGEVPSEYLEALATLPFLREASRPELLRIALHLELREEAAGTILVRQGAPGDRFYLIRAGSVRVGKLTSEGRAIQLATLGPGDYFGETALVVRVARTASVIAESNVRLLALDAGHFRRWIGQRDALASEVRKSLADRRRLAELPLFRGTGPAELDRLAARFLITRYSAGDVIVRQGEPGDRFFLIVDGRVEVIREEPDGPRRLAELSVGEYFGEMALLHDAPRSATIRALTAVETYTLSAADFHDLLGRLPAAAELRETAAERAGIYDRPTPIKPFLPTPATPGPAT